MTNYTGQLTKKFGHYVNSTFRHREQRTRPDSSFFVEFPPGPLAIGEEPVKKIVEKKLSTGVLKIISPTDCVKDRLSAYYHWNDQQSLQQASFVAQQNKVDLKEIERWSEAEGKIDEFGRIKNKLAKSK